MDSGTMSLPKELSLDGIRQFFNPGPNAPNQQFIFQLTKLTEDYSGSKIFHLSDGFCFVKGVMVGEARNKVIKGDVELYDVIVLRREDVKFLGLEKQICLEIKNLMGSNIRMLCSIGNPVSYITYFQNNFVNRKGSIVISEGQKVENNMTLTQILEHYPHTPSKWVLQAKVIKKPERINPEKPFMIISLMDEEGKVIEGVFFGPIAIENFAKLSNGKEYLFNNGQIKQKKDREEFQIKFNEASQIIPIETTKSKPDFSFPQEESKVKNITHNQGSLVSLTGKVLKIKQLSKGRSLSVVDISGDIMEVVLWEEFNDEIQERETYHFEDFRTKAFHSNVSLQSMRGKSKVTRADNQIQSGIKVKDNQFNLNRKEIKDPDSILSVTEMLELNVNQRLYKDVNGFLVINTAYMDTKNFFKVECLKCGGKDIGTAPLSCRKCDSKNPVVRWNLRCHIIDEKQDIKCIMNEELCEKLIKMTSLEGYIRLLHEPDSLKKIIDQISHLQGIFKVKVNPYRDSIYYNILEIYKNDSTMLLKKAYKEMRATMLRFNQKVH